MKKCDCYYTEEKIIGWHTPVDPKTTIVHKCNGTRERDECSCGGDRTKCDFYPEVREKALKEQEPKFCEWISVKDRLPDIDELCLLSMENRITKYRWVVIGYYHTNYDEYVTHWMPLPTPPIEKE
jgi:hypothetical protein